MGFARFKLLRYPLYAIGTYLAYAGYVVYATNAEIQARENLPYALKYSPMKVLGRYQNPFPEYCYETLFHFAYHNIRNVFSAPAHWPISQMPIYRPNLDPPSQLKYSVTWLGQLSAYVQTSEVSILTDPVFSSRMLGSLGPRRASPSPVEATSLHPDIVMISHDHPDHLDPKAVAALAGNTALWVVPKGLSKRLERYGVSKESICELTWWERRTLLTSDSARWSVLCVPSMHWLGCYGPDFNKTLWAGFILFRNREPIVFHIGDLGYSEGLYKAIAQELDGQETRLVLAPVGQCEVPHHHMGPSEAAKVGMLLHAKTLLGVHYGTYRTGGLEPCAMRDLMRNNGVRVADIGETLEI